MIIIIIIVIDTTPTKTQNCDRPSSPSVCHGRTKCVTQCTRLPDRVKSF